MKACFFFPETQKREHITTSLKIKNTDISTMPNGHVRKTSNQYLKENNPEEIPAPFH